MRPNSNFKDLLNALNQCHARYLVVGGYAVMLYTEPRCSVRWPSWFIGIDDLVRNKQSTRPGDGPGGLRAPGRSAEAGVAWITAPDVYPTNPRHFSEPHTQVNGIISTCPKVA